MATLNNPNGFDLFAITEGSQTTQRLLEVPTETVRLWYDKLAIKKEDVTENRFGVYSFGRFDRAGKARMSSLTVPKHLLQPRTNCRTWNPKGNISITDRTVHACDLEFMGEQCTDTLFGDCLEYILGGGNDKWDMLATPEGQRLFNLMVNKIFLGLNNSTYDYVTFSNHPLITDSNTNSWWDVNTTTDGEWADFLDQQTGTTCKGHLTLIDEAKTEGLDHFNTVINASDISADGKSFTGDAIALFKELEETAPLAFQIAMNDNRQEMMPKLLVSPSIFYRYREQLITQYDTVPESYQFFVTRDGIQSPMRGVLRYGGMEVIAKYDWQAFDRTVGVNTHRAVLTMPGNMFIGYDVPELNQSSGLGMRIQQRFDLPHKGEVYMHTTLQLGAGIVDTDFMANASIVVTPS